jgi:hypothetical protein
MAWKGTTMCCGSGRAAWRNASSRPRAPAAAARAPGRTPVEGGAPGVYGRDPVVSPRVPPTASFHAFVVRYTGASTIRLQGPVTGQPYEFSRAQPIQAVDVRDAAVLVRNGLLQLA